MNREFAKNRTDLFTQEDLEAIQGSVDDSFGRPHIANYMVQKGIVKSRQEAFDRFLVKCNVPKMPVSIEEACGLIRGAGGKLMPAHPNDPNGTSLASFTDSLHAQFHIIRDSMLPFIDGIECRHSRHTPQTSTAYVNFARKEGLLVSGGSDCHQDPVIMGSVAVPSYVVDQFAFQVA